MKNTQKGFVNVVLIGVIILVVGLGGYFTFKHYIGSECDALTNCLSKEKYDKSNTLSCAYFDEFSQFILKNIQKPDSQSATLLDKNFRWKRKGGEPFVTYPIVKSTIAFYGLSNGNSENSSVTSTDFMSAIKNDSNSISANLNKEATSLGLTADMLNTIPFQSFNLPVSEIHPIGTLAEYFQIFGFKKGDDLYSVVLKAEKGFQAPGEGTVTITCGKPIASYDHAYDVLNFKSDTLVTNKYDDYVEIFSVSPDSKVYEIFGSGRHINIANYYFIDGSTAKLVSSNSAPTDCSILETQKVGKGMTCVDKPSYNQRTVNYTSQSTGDSQSISVPGMSKYTDSNLGFSFWYPSSWKVVAGQDSIRLLDSQGKDTDLSITRSSPTNGKLLLPGYACGPAEGCADITYYFDVTTHTWMEQHGTQIPIPANVSTNTMGGLHMFNGNIRFGLGTVIPLSAHNFLMIDASPGGLGGGEHNFQDYLAKTIVATDSSVATPVSSAEQTTTIQAEASAYSTAQ